MREVATPVAHIPASGFLPWRTRFPYSPGGFPHSIPAGGMGFQRRGLTVRGGHRGDSVVIGRNPLSAYSTLVKDARRRRAALQSEIADARRLISRREDEMATLDAVVDALSTLAGAGAAKPGRKPAGGRKGGARKRAAGAAAKPRKRGGWKPGGPGRPPKWYTEKMAAEAAAAAGADASDAAPAKPAKKKGRRTRRSRKPAKK